MKHYILYNPLAGKGANQDKLDALKATCGEDTECLAVTDIADMSAFCASLSADDTVILCGGDGTLNRFVNDTEGVSISSDILYYAMGTGNDFLHDLGKAPDAKPFSVKKYISDLPTVTVKGKTYRFLNNVGFGIDGYCCEVGDKQKVERPGKAVNYTSIAINGLLFNYKPKNAIITVDGVEYRYKKVWLAPTMKGRYYGGGMMATPDQDRNDPEGTLSVMLFHGKGRIATLIAFPSIFKGEHVKKKNMVAVHSGKTISVQFDAPAAVQIDGETILGVTEYTATAKVTAPVTV